MRLPVATYEPLDPACCHGGAIYSRRRPPGQQGTAIFGQTNDILEIIQLIHILVAVIASTVLFVVSWLTTLDFGNFSSAFGLFGALAWVSLEAYCIYWI